MREPSANEEAERNRGDDRGRSRRPDEGETRRDGATDDYDEMAAERAGEYDPMRAPEERQPDAESYDTSSAEMPPSPAGGNADVGGEAAASRRTAGLPPKLRDAPEHRAGQATADAEPFLGYDGLKANDVIGWITEADPDPDRLRRILDYERDHRDRARVVQECEERLRRFQA